MIPHFQVPQPQHTDSEEGYHQNFEEDSAITSDTNDVGHGNFFNEFYSDIEKTDLSSDEILHGNLDTSVMSGDSSSESKEFPSDEKNPSKEYHIQGSRSHFEGTQTDSTVKSIEDDSVQFEHLDASGELPDHSVGASTKENKEDDQTVVVTGSESKRAYNIADNEENVGPPERKEDSHVVQDSEKIETELEEHVDLPEKEADNKISDLGKSYDGNEENVDKPEKEENSYEKLDSEKIERDHKENVDLPEKEEDSNELPSSGKIEGDHEENIDKPVKEEDSYEALDSEKIENDKFPIGEEPSESSSEEKVLQPKTNSEEPTSSQETQNPDDIIIDDDVSVQKGKKIESEHASDLPNDGKDKGLMFVLLFSHMYILYSI